MSAGEFDSGKVRQNCVNNKKTMLRIVKTERKIKPERFAPARIRFTIPPLRIDSFLQEIERLHHSILFFYNNRPQCLVEEYL